MALFGVTAAPEAVSDPERSASSSCWLVAMTMPPPASWNDVRGETAGGFAPPNQFDQNAMGFFRTLVRSQHQDAVALPDGMSTACFWVRLVHDIQVIPTGEGKMYKHILIATDGSELARKGLEHGLSLAKPLGAKVTVLTVSEPMRPEVERAARMGGVDDPAGRFDQQIDAIMKERFAFIEQRGSEHGITADLMHEIDDSPAEAIVRFAKLRGCDLIVMSSHGRRGVQKVLLGSQTSEVLANTTIPVLVVR